MCRRSHLAAPAVICFAACFHSAGLAAGLPEDLYCLIKKAVTVRNHLERNRKDNDSKFRLILIESRIHRLARYYKRQKVVPATFKYESATASALVA
jgi:small subunit ribosomal protein S13e